MEGLHDTELRVQAMQFAMEARDPSRPSSFDLIGESSKIYKWLKSGKSKESIDEDKRSDRFTIEEVIDLHIQNAKNKTFTKGKLELYIISQVYRWWEACKSEGSKKYNNDQIIEALSKIFNIEICTK